MFARIIKIAENKVVIQDENEEIYDVQKTELDFKYKLGDEIEMIQNGDEYFFLPLSKEETTQHTVKNATAPKATSVATKQSKKNGASGWLSFFIITAILGAIATVAQVTNFENIDSTTCSLANISFSTCSELNNIIDFERTFGLILGVWQIITAVILIKSTKRSAIANVYLLLAARIVVNLIDILWTDSVVPTSISRAGSYQSALMTDAIVIIYSTIWLIYFACSKQVKETYTD